MMPGKTSGISSSQDATVYTIFAGMIPTLGFDRGDFTVDRAGDPTKYRSSAVSLGLAISPQGRQRQARVRGSVAWYEYSTTVRAIHEEVMGDDANSVLRWPRDWRDMFEGDSPLVAGLAQEFTDQMGVDAIRPQGEDAEESYSGVRGEKSEQEAGGDWGDLHKADDATDRAEGRLVNRANSIDMYFRGRDNNIYRIDVTTMSMSASHGAHHGLGTGASRTAAGVDSDSLLATLSGGNTDVAEERLLTYFQGRTREYNQVIKTLKQHLRDTTHHGADFLKNLNLGDDEQLAEIREELEAAFDTHGSSWMNNPNKTDPMSQLRPNLTEAMRRMGTNSQLMQGRAATDAGLQSSVKFVLHALGNVVNSKARGSQGTITEYRITAPSAPVPWTIGVMHKIINSGQSVLEFMGLKKGDVRVYNEVALENAFIRANIDGTRQTQDAILHQTNLDRNFEHAAYLIAQDNTAVQVGDLVASSMNGMCRSGTTLKLGAQAVISPRRFNAQIDDWIQRMGNPNDNRAFVGRLHPWLRRHIQEGPEIEQRGRTSPNVRNTYAQIASPVRAAQTGPNSLNTFNMLSSENTEGKNPYERDLFALDVSGAEMGSSEMQALISEREAALPLRGAFNRDNPSWAVAGNLLRGASGTNEHVLKNLAKFSRKDSETMEGMGRYPGSDRYEGERAMGTAMNVGLMGEFRRNRPGMNNYYYQQLNAFALEMGGNTGRDPATRFTQRKYWGLQEYLSRDSQQGFDDNVTPSWWAAPYVSIEYGSGKLGS